MARSLQSLRTLLRTKLEEVTIYVTPPENTKRDTPCIILERDRGDVKFADNVPYANMRGYSLTVISLDADSDLLNIVESFPLCQFNRHFIADNLHHDVYTIFH